MLVFQFLQIKNQKYICTISLTVIDTVAFKLKFYK